MKMNDPYLAYCRSCKKQMAADYEFCPHCGANQKTPEHTATPPQPPCRIVGRLLCH